MSSSGRRQQLVGQRRVHRAGQGAAGGRGRRLRQRGAERCGSLVRGGDRDRGTHRHALRVIGRQRRDDLFRGLQPRPARRLLGHREHAVARLAHEVPEHLRVGGARLQQPSCVSQERVARLDRLDLGKRAVGLLGVAAGVAPQTHGSEVEERRPPGLTHVLDGACRRRPRSRRSHRPPGSSARCGCVAERVRDPALGSRHADAGLVVLADQQQGHRQAQACRVAGGVDGRERRRVVRARVAERAGHDRVAGEAVRHAEALRARQAEGEAHRLRQVAGDGARLRRHPQRPAAPHLVTALADRILAGGDHPEQRVEDRRASRQLAGARHHEGTRPIVQECRIVDPQPAPRRRRCSRVRPSRWCRSCGWSSSAHAPRRRAGARRAGPRTGRRRARAVSSAPSRSGASGPAGAAPAAPFRESCRALARRWRRDPRSCGDR